MKLPISAIILTLNEENAVGDALRSIAAWAGEIFVVDSGSRDRTQEIVSGFTPHFIRHPFENYAAQRNWAQDHLPLTYEWVFHLDADERASAELSAEIAGLFAAGAPRQDGFLFARRTVFAGTWIRHGGHYPVYHLRLFKRANGRCEERLYDQHFYTSGTLLQCRGDIINVINDDVAALKDRHRRWAKMEAQELRTKGLLGSKTLNRDSPIAWRRNLRYGLYYRLPPFARVFFYFFVRLILLGGFLDGINGMRFHYLHGFWYRMQIDTQLLRLKLQAPESPDRKRA